MNAPRLAAVLAVPVLLLAACGDDEGAVVDEDAVVDEEAVETGGADAALARLQGAPDALAEAGSVRLEMTMTMAAMGESFEVTAQGGIDGDQALFTMDLGDMLGAAGGFGAEPGETMPEGFDEPMTIVVDGTTTYMKVPMAAMFTGTDGWLSVTAEDVGVAEDSLGLGIGGSGNPAQLVEGLRGISEEIEELGTEEVRGTDTTHYRVVVDLEKAAAELPEEARAAFEQQVGSLGVTTLPFEVWLSEEGLVHRMSMDLADLAGQVEPDELDELESGTMVLELFDYGADLDIEIPDPSEVTPFSEVMAGMDPSALG